MDFLNCFARMVFSIQLSVPNSISLIPRLSFLETLSTSDCQSLGSIWLHTYSWVKLFWLAFVDMSLGCVECLLLTLFSFTLSIELSKSCNSAKVISSSFSPSIIFSYSKFYPPLSMGALYTFRPDSSIKGDMKRKSLRISSRFNKSLISQHTESPQPWFSCPSLNSYLSGNLVPTFKHS